MLTTASVREYCSGKTRRDCSVESASSGTASSKGHFPFGTIMATWASAPRDMRAIASPPYQHAAALSGWCSRHEASPTIRASSQRRAPKCTANAIPASRAAADEPHPLPMGISFSMCSASLRDALRCNERFDFADMRSSDQTSFEKPYCLAAVLLSFTSRSDEYAAAPATMILAAMTGLEWIITPYVIQKRAATDWIQRSFAGSFAKYEIVNTAVAIQPTPSSINTPVPFPNQAASTLVREPSVQLLHLHPALSARVADPSACARSG